jgi:O-acetylserine/cysteine efflux transporter
MNLDRRRALMALTVAGLLWGSTVPLSKLALGWLPPGWLTAVRFAVAAAVLLTVTRSRVRAACSPAVLAWGAAGYGGTVLLQNTGITRTSVSHAALLIGTAPVLVAIIAVVWHHSVVRPVAWAGFAVSLGGVGLIAVGGGGGADLGGDGMVLASVLLSAIFTVGQTRLLRGRDPIAVTAVQFLGAALVTAPFSALTEGVPPAPSGTGSLLAVVALIAGGTLLPFTLFAFGQSRLPAEIAGAFLNIEPLVGAVAGVVAFGDPAGPAQMAGGAAILGGIALSSVRWPGRRQARPAVAAQAAVAEQAAVVAEPVLVAQAAGAGRHGALDGRDLLAALDYADLRDHGPPLDHWAALDYEAALDNGPALDCEAELDYRAALDRHAGRRRRVLAANRASSTAEARAARHPEGLRRAGLEHGVGRPPQIGRRRPRGQIRPGGRQQETRGPGDGRRGEPRPAVRGVTPLAGWRPAAGP